MGRQGTRGSSRHQASERASKLALGASCKADCFQSYALHGCRGNAVRLRAGYLSSTNFCSQTRDFFEETNVQELHLELCCQCGMAMCCSLWWCSSACWCTSWKNLLGSGSHLQKRLHELHLSQSAAIVEFVLLFSDLSRGRLFSLSNSDVSGQNSQGSNALSICIMYVLTAALTSDLHYWQADMCSLIVDWTREPSKSFSFDKDRVTWSLRSQPAILSSYCTAKESG